MEYPSYVYICNTSFAQKMWDLLDKYPDDLSEWNEPLWAAFSYFTKDLFLKEVTDYKLEYIITHSRKTRCAGKGGYMKTPSGLNGWGISLARRIHKTKYQLVDTALHELGHVIQHQKYPRQPGKKGVKPHGKEWKECCLLLCYTNYEVYHKMDTKDARRKVSRHIYSCECDKNTVSTTTVHNRIQKGTHIYRCQTCRQVLVKRDYLETRKV